MKEREKKKAVLSRTALDDAPDQLALALHSQFSALGVEVGCKTANPMIAATAILIMVNIVLVFCGKGFSHHENRLTFLRLASILNLRRNLAIRKESF